LSVYEEGLPSIPEYYEGGGAAGAGARALHDLDGKLHEEDAEGLSPPAIRTRSIISIGVLFVDYLSN